MEALLAFVVAWKPYVLAAAALVMAPVIGALLMGLDRILTARIQGRVGPPLLQPFYDIVKLLGKAPIALNRVQVVYACLHLALMMLVVVLLAMGQDLMMILFVHAFSNIALILGGMSVRSPYSRIGSQRQIMQMLAYEPILVLMVVGIYLIFGTFQISRIPAGGVPLLVQLPLVFLAFQMVISIKLQKSPFDVSTSHHAHQEIVKGITIEYSGPYLAVIEITHLYETCVLFTVVALFWAPNPLVGLLLAALSFLFQIVLDNACARLTTMWMLRYMWTLPMVLAVSNIAWLYLRNGASLG